MRKNTWLSDITSNRFTYVSREITQLFSLAWITFPIYSALQIFRKESHPSVYKQGTSSKEGLSLFGNRLFVVIKWQFLVTPTHSNQLYFVYMRNGTALGPSWYGIDGILWANDIAQDGSLLIKCSHATLSLSQHGTPLPRVNQSPPTENHMSWLKSWRQKNK